jgi:uncharacterized protein (TIGR02246 family)
MVDAPAVSLYEELLAAWSNNDAHSFAELFTLGGSIVGFDGSMVNGQQEIRDHLQQIFADHRVGTYVSKIREVRELAPAVVLVRAVAGLIPDGSADLKPELNAVQSLVAVSVDEKWRVALFQNTPAAFHGRPDEVEQLTAELREAMQSA